MAGQSREAGRSVASRALDILAAFEGSARSLPLNELAESAGLAPSTAHRLLKELVQWGALTKDDKGRYQIGLRLWELGQNAGRNLREIPRPYLQDLFDLTHETVHIAIREGAEVLYIDRIYSSRRVPRASKVGGRLPMHATAVGKVLLANEEQWVIDAYLERPLEQSSPQTHTDPAKLRGELVRVKELGYAVTVEEVRAGSCSIAVPVFTGEGPIGASVGLVLLADQAKVMDKYLPALRGTAAQIERATARYPLRTLRATASIPRSQRQD